MSQKIHRFYLNFLFFGLILAGVAGFNLLKITALKDNIWLISGLLLLVAGFVISRRFCVIFIIAAALIIAGWRSSNFNFEQAKIAKFMGKSIIARGIVVEDPDVAEDGDAKIRIELESLNGELAKGKVLATFKAKKLPRRGDLVEVSGKMSAGFGAFAGSVYRAKLIKIEPRTDFIRDTRDWFAQNIRQFIASPAADLGLGYLLGQKNSLPSELDKALRATALTHIVVASGYNLTVLAQFARRRLSGFSRRLAFILSILLITGFVLVVGFTPSMVRAGVVAIFGVLMWYFSREVRPYFLLIFVAGLTLLISPSNLFELGWQLSFGSFFGVMILSPILQQFLFEKPQKLNSFAKMFFETFSAQIITLPLVVSTFGVVSSVSILANLAVLPLVPLAMLLTFLTGILSFMPVLAQIFGWLASFILDATIEIIQFFAKIPNAQVELTLDGHGVVICYLAMILVIGFLSWKVRPQTTAEKLKKTPFSDII